MESLDTRVYTEDEIEFFLAGDRCAVDRHILHALNNISAILANHTKTEDEVVSHLEQVGGFDAILTRAEYVDSMIRRNNKLAAMAEKVTQSVLIWAVIAALGMLFIATFDGLLASLKAALHIRNIP